MLQGQSTNRKFEDFDARAAQSCLAAKTDAFLVRVLVVSSLGLSASCVGA